MNKIFSNVTLRGVLLLILFTITSNSKAGETLFVPKDYATIQSALNAAKNNDVIFIEDGTYNENLILILNKNLTIEGSSENVIIDGSKQNRCINVIGDTETTYSLAIKNIKFVNGNSDTEGGALRISNISLNLNGVYIENSYSLIKAGAIYFQGEGLEINNCQFSNNSSQDCGGIYANGINLKLNTTIFNKNVSIDTSTGVEKSGGAVMIFENFDIKSCEFTDNESYYGGGLWCSGNGTISNSIFKNNTSRAWLGAALSVDGNSVITNIEANNNISSEEAVIVMTGNCIIKDSHFKDNKGSVFGPRAGEHKVENCNLLNNTLAVGYSGSHFTSTVGKIILKQTQIVYNKTKDLSTHYTDYCAIKRYEQGIELVDCQILGYYYGVYCNKFNEEPISLTRTTITNCDYGIWCEDNIVNISNCNICFNTNGILNKGNGSVAVTGSNLYNNDFAVKNENDSKLLDCKNNYWGDESGPLHPLFNTSGLGDETNEYVDVMPYMDQFNCNVDLNPITIKEIVYENSDLEIKYLSYQKNINSIKIDCIQKYGDIKYSYTFDAIEKIVISDLPEGHYQIYASYVTTEGHISLKSAEYDFLHLNGSTDIYVPIHYPTIKIALDEVKDGYTIYVADGTYNESINCDFFEEKSFNLIGNAESPENVIIDSNGQGSGCIRISVYGQNKGNINIDGFTFTGSKGDYQGALYFNDIPSVEIKNCIVHDNSHSQGAIQFYLCPNASLSHTLVYGNTGPGVWSSRSGLNVDRSTLTYNSGSDLHAEYCNVKVNNSIVWNTKFDALSTRSGSIVMDYCCVNSDLLNQYITSTNSIHDDPTYKSIDEKDYSLKNQSPCIAAGDPNHELSIGGAINIGYYGNNTLTGIGDEINGGHYKLRIMFNNVSMEFDKVQSFIELRIYDLSGMLVDTITQNNTSQINYIFSQNKGVFILHYKLKNSSVIEKVLIK